MRWNWQQKDWPVFKYDEAALEGYEADFLHKSGQFSGAFQHINKQDKLNLRISLICDEALKTSEIEGEYLNRDSLRSSISRNFGLLTNKRKASVEEEGISEMMADLYQNFDKEVSHKSLSTWYSLIIEGHKDIEAKNCYRCEDDLMQVVSGPVHKPKVHFEAPNAGELFKEMEAFIGWFNGSSSASKKPLPALTRSGIAHLYFVCIHPFEDGNGRIARALAEKSLSQSLGQATLIALSITIEKERTKYYKALEQANKDLEITPWLQYFAETVLKAQSHSQKMLEFLIEKTKFYEQHRTELNSRQEKVIARIFEEGVDGFEGGLSAENYISITKTSRATATRDLQDLVEKNIFKKIGQLKSTRYYIKYS